MKKSAHAHFALIQMGSLALALHAKNVAISTESRKNNIVTKRQETSIQNQCSTEASRKFTTLQGLSLQGQGYSNKHTFKVSNPCGETTEPTYRIGREFQKQMAERKKEFR